MNTRIALVMHEPLGAAFEACARHVLGRVPDLTVFDIAPDADPATQTGRILEWMRARGPAEPVLILCDLYGATPFNIAAQALRQALDDGYVAHLLTGTNACMVLKALTDQQENPESLSERVRQGALRGIVNAEPPCAC
ncbi:PTS EIIA type-4 domain-containing protein OS=Castellaniella defragrans (strain DSM / CCUG 39792/ 65Phen) OX=1437824 GN=BN940_08936 PE=4 SV=1 [Castellaniella denitrificans]|jgi:PTS system ascorbate-specific IIA component|uniref:PTS sugar transporter subunit IIA n=1 Tax=Castellaniella denitrificans TaxID=56119 RepID=UPI003621E1C5